MKLGRNSRDLLELMAVFGLESLEAVFALPSFYRLISCSSRQSFQRTTRLLERKGLVSSVENQSTRGDWVGTLTLKGKSIITDSIDPTTFWEANWDGNWRLMSFDLPTKATAERQALRNWLKRYRFGRLQGSVWITPRDLGDWSQELTDLNVDPQNIVFISGKLGATSQPSQFVEKAWDFERINRKYKKHRDFIAANPVQSHSHSDFKSWFRNESERWRDAHASDPFLPRILWPEHFKTEYLGPPALKERARAYKEWKTILGMKLY